MDGHEKHERHERGFWGEVGGGGVVFFAAAERLPSGEPGGYMGGGLRGWEWVTYTWGYEGCCDFNFPRDFDLPMARFSQPRSNNSDSC